MIENVLEEEPYYRQANFVLKEAAVAGGWPETGVFALQTPNLLGRCYRKLGMFDLAVKQLEDAAKEILTMDAMKKKIVYNLGLVFEQMDDSGKSVACMKQIYEADYGYKDVAARVASSYRPEAQSS